MMDKLIGEVVRGSYRILHRLTEGELGVSYEAERLRSPGTSALVRVFHPAAITDPRGYSRYVMEAELVASLDHPNVVDVEGFGELPDGRPYVVTERLVGEDLGRRLERRGPLSAEQVACLLEQAGSALQMMHQQGILHRDLTPGRVFLVRGGPADGVQVKVLDFGISRLRVNLRLTRQEVSLQTMLFMAPEQISGDISKVGRYTDVFALTALAYNALSGRLPFESRSAAGLLSAICNTWPTPITGLLPDLPPDLHRVLSRGMAKASEERYQEANHLAEDFRAVLSGQPPAHVGDWQPPAMEPPVAPPPAATPEPRAAPAVPKVALPLPVTAPRAPVQQTPRSSIVLSPRLRAYSRPAPIEQASPEDVRDTAIMDVGAGQRHTRPGQRDDRITEEQDPVVEQQASQQKPATGIIAVDELQQGLDQTRVEQPQQPQQPPTTGFLAMDELGQQATEEELPADEKKTMEMSGPELLALQQEDTFSLERAPEAEDEKATVKVVRPPKHQEEQEPGGEVNMELMKTVREPD